MEGFLDGLPKNRDDPDAHVEVSIVLHSRVYFINSKL